MYESFQIRVPAKRYLRLQRQNRLHWRLALPGPHDAGHEAPQKAALRCTAPRRPRALHFPPRQYDALLLLHRLLNGLHADPLLQGMPSNGRDICKGLL